VVASILVGLATSLWGRAGVNYLTLARVPAWYTVSGMVGLWVGFVTAWLVARRRTPEIQPTNFFRIRVSDVRYVLVGAAVQGLVALVYAPFHVKGVSTPVHRIFDGQHGAALVAVFVSIGVLAPLAEEVLFRAILHRGLTLALPSTWFVRGSSVLAVLVSSALFAGAHFEAAQFAGLFLTGVVLAVLLDRTSRLAPSALAHMGFNLTALTFALVVHGR
jgi:membrane protease YdiL (CAAX protease family)